MSAWTAERLAAVLRGEADGPWATVAGSTSPHRAAVEAGLHGLGLRLAAGRGVPLSSAELRAAGIPVTEPFTFELDGTPTPGGLFSVATTPGVIELPEPVPHPLAAGATLDAIPVLPGDLRRDDDALTDAYRRLVNRRNRFARLLDLGAPDAIVTQEREALRGAVDALLTGPALGFLSRRIDALEADDALDAALATLREDDRSARHVAALAVRALPARELIHELTQIRLEEVGAAWGMSRRRALRKLLTDALFHEVPADHPAYPQVAAARVDALAAAGDLTGALALAAGDDPLRVAVLEAEAGDASALEAQAGAEDEARAWQARIALGMHHLRALRIAPAMAAFHRAALLPDRSAWARPVRLPPLPAPANATVGEIASCLLLNGLLSCGTLAGLLGLSTEVDDGELLRAQVLPLVRKSAARRDPRALENLRELGRYLTEAGDHEEAVAALQAGLHGWPPGRDRDLLENDLALALGRADRPGDAVKALRELYARVGEPEVGINLALALIAADRPADAVLLLPELPPSLPRDIALCRAHLALGDPAAARDAVAAAHAALDDAGLPTAEGAQLTDVLLDALLALRDPAAEGVQRRMWAATLETGDGPAAWLEEANLAGVLTSLGRPAEAIPILERTLAVHEQAFGASSSFAGHSRRLLQRATGAGVTPRDPGEVVWEPLRLPRL